MRYNSPLRYPGGKGRLFPFISSILNENGLVGSAYAEPYTGGGGLALRLLYEGYITRAHLNDLDPCLYAFWRSALNMTDEFCAWVEAVPVTIKTWRDCKEIVRNAGQATEFELGVATFFLNRTNMSGILTGGVMGGLSQSGRCKITDRFNRDSLIRKVQKIGAFRDRITITNIDGLSFLRDLSKIDTAVFVYLDPPYYTKSKTLYNKVFAGADHTGLSAYVSQMGAPWAMSYDDQDCIKRLYSNAKIISHVLYQSTSNTNGRELLIFDNGLKVNESLRYLNSPEVMG